MTMNECWENKKTRQFTDGNKAMPLFVRDGKVKRQTLMKNTL